MSKCVVECSGSCHTKSHFAFIILLYIYYHYLFLLLFFALQHCVSGDIRDLVKERWYKSLHADRLTPTTGVAEGLLHKLKYLYKDSYS